MKYLISGLFLISVTSCGPCGDDCCKKSSLAFDHMALKCSDVDASADWYMTVFQTEEIENKTDNPEIRWLSLGDAELHLSPADTVELVYHKSVHMAMAILDIDQFAARLDSLNIYWEGWADGPGKITTRPDGVRQIYFQDPDGYWIEVNDAQIK